MRSRFLILTALFACALCTGRAEAQLDDGVVTASRLGPDQLDDIDQFVGNHEDDLTNTDPNKRSRARNALLEPLDQSAVSVDFRMRYSDRLMPGLQRVVGNADTRIAINGLRIAGALATQESTQLLIDAADDKRDDMRYVSAWGIRQTFEEADGSAPAITQERLQELLELLELRLGNEDEPHVFDVVGRAFTAAGQINRDRWRALRDNAQLAQARATAQRVRSLNPGPDDRALLIAVSRTLEAQLRAIKDDYATDEVAREGAGLAGQVVSYAAARARAGDIEGIQRLELQDLVRRAEALIYFAHNALDPVGEPTSTKLGDLLAEDGDPTRFDDAKFAEQAEAQLIGHGGVLCHPPLGFSPRQFARSDD